MDAGVSTIEKVVEDPRDVSKASDPLLQDGHSRERSLLAVSDSSKVTRGMAWL